MTVNKENKCLLHIYWVPKLHENPAKAWFTIAALNCSLNPLFKSITAILKVLLH